MTMCRRMGAMLLVLLVWAMIAFAAPKTTVTSLGTLSAKGTGNARLMVAKGTVTIAGKGIFMVSQDAKVMVKGVQGKKVDPRTLESQHAGPARGGGFHHGAMGDMMGKMVAYEGFNGVATVSSTQFFVVGLRGDNIVVKAQGAGEVMLMGDGTYATTKKGNDGKATGKWLPMPKGEPGEHGGPGGPGGRPMGPPPSPGGPMGGRPGGPGQHAGGNWHGGAGGHHMIRFGDLTIEFPHPAGMPGGPGGPHH